VALEGSWDMVQGFDPFAKPVEPAIWQFQAFFHVEFRMAFSHFIRPIAFYKLF
jgi:hypothetical protein